MVNTVNTTIVKSMPFTMCMGMGLQMLGIILFILSCAPKSIPTLPKGEEPSAIGTVTNISVDRAFIYGTSFKVQWTAPTIPGTKLDGTRINPHEIVYRVYYLAATTDNTDNTDQTVPSSLSIRLDPNVLVKNIAAQSHTEILGVEEQTRFYVTVASYNSFADLETSTDEVVLVKASHDEPINFVGILDYRQEYRFTVNSIGTITPLSRPNKYDTDTSNVEISYTLEKEEGMDFGTEPSIDNYGEITINPISNAGIASYNIHVSAHGYNTQSVTIILIIDEDENLFQVASYHSGASDSFPVGLGQAIEDDVSQPFSLQNNQMILEFKTPVDGNFYVHFGDQEGIYYTRLEERQSNSRILQILKSDLTNDIFSFNNFSYTEGAVIGISGTGIRGTLHIATYYPFIINNVYDLQAMRNRLFGNYTLKNDINFPRRTINSFVAIGDENNQFIGTLDGAGFSITGLSIYNTEKFQGLFGVIVGATDDTVVVKDLDLRNFNIKGNVYVGALAAWLQRGVVKNIRGVIEDSDEGKVEISGSLDVDGYNDSFGGGLIGRAGTGGSKLRVKIENASSEYSVEGTGSEIKNIGGLIGFLDSDAELIEGITTADVTANNGDNVGGLIGWNKGTSSGHATGDVTGSDNVGGLIGWNKSTASGYATGVVLGYGKVGGLVGRNSASLTGHATGAVSGKYYVGGLVGLNFSGSVASGYANGDVTGTSWVGGLTGDNSGTLSGHATGTIRSDEYYLGGLAGVNDGTLSGYMNGDVIGTVIGDYVGGLVGFNSNIVSGYVTGSVSGGIYVGGLVGDNIGSVSGYVSASVTGTGEYVGGLVGDNENSVYGYVTGTVTGSSNYVGGLVGDNNGTVLGYATALVIGSGEFVGGLIGFNSSTSIVSGYARGLVRRASGTSTFYGKTIGSDANNGTVNSYSSTVESKLYDGETGEMILTGSTGIHGSELSTVNLTTQTTFTGFTFGTDNGEWTWLESGKWPAINLGTAYPFDGTTDAQSSANEQPTEPTQ